MSEDLSGDPVEFIVWYLNERPIFTFSVAMAIRRDRYRETKWQR